MFWVFTENALCSVETEEIKPICNCSSLHGDPRPGHLSLPLLRTQQKHGRARFTLGTEETQGP